MNHQIISGHSTRMAKFGRSGVTLRALAGQSLSDEVIAARCPSVFAANKFRDCSAKYSYIPTIDMLADMRREGFLPVEVRQGGSKDEEKRGFTKHMVRFRPASRLALTNVGDTVPELLMLNSHDRTSSYQLMLGAFRLICSNGLIIADGSLEGVKVPHFGRRTMDDVIEASFTVIKEADDALPKIEDMRRLMLSPPEQEAFARSAIPLRFDEDTAIRPDQLLRPHRAADAGNDLWSTFNRVQENVIGGGLRYDATDSNGRRRHWRTRQVNGIDQDVRLNRALWTLAEEMRQLKAN
jgi:hypothetical protein